MSSHFASLERGHLIPALERELGEDMELVPRLHGSSYTVSFAQDPSRSCVPFRAIAFVTDIPKGIKNKGFRADRTEIMGKTFEFQALSSYFSLQPPLQGDNIVWNKMSFRITSIQEDESCVIVLKAIEEVSL